MMKSRIVETEDGWFYPQYKPGWLSRWRGYNPRADRMSFPVLEIWVSEHDPARSARFQTEAEAAAFIARVSAMADAGWEEQRQSRERAAAGLKAKRITRP